MENIQGMLEEIRGVVQNHFQDENQKISKTMSVLENLPIVIALRHRVAELTKINERMQESLRHYEEKANIEENPRPVGEKCTADGEKMASIRLQLNNKS